MQNPKPPARRHEPPPPSAPSYHPNSAQHQLARACSVKLVMGPYSSVPRARTKRAAGLCNTYHAWVV